VAGADVLDERTVRFRFRQPNRELPLTVGGLPVFSRVGGGKPFDQVVMDRPSAAGRTASAGQLRQGHHLRARPQLLGARSGAKRGSDNFDRIRSRSTRTTRRGWRR
jgi:microcin C transport system substrate-binding protein